MRKELWYGRIQGFIKYTPLLKQLVSRDIKVRYRKSVLGMLWTVLNPLMMMGVMTIVFSTLFKSNIENFPVYFLTGNILFSFNSEATQQALMSIISNASLVKKIYIPKYLFPFSRVLSCLVNLFFSLIALIIVMVITKAPFFPTMLLIPIPIVYLIVFTTGISLILSSLTVFFRDIGHFYSVFILAWSYFTPIFYPESIIPSNYRWIIKANPLYHFINYLRMIVREGTIPNSAMNIQCFLISIVTLLLGIFIFMKKQDKFILHI